MSVETTDCIRYSSDVITLPRHTVPPKKDIVFHIFKRWQIFFLDGGGSGKCNLQRGGCRWVRIQRQKLYKQYQFQMKTIAIKYLRTSGGQFLIVVGSQ